MGSALETLFWGCCPSLRAPSPMRCLDCCPACQPTHNARPNCCSMCCLRLPLLFALLSPPARCHGLGPLQLAPRSPTRPTDQFTHAQQVPIRDLLRVGVLRVSNRIPRRVRARTSARPHAPVTRPPLAPMGPSALPTSPETRGPPATYIRTCPSSAGRFRVRCAGFALRAPRTFAPSLPSGASREQRNSWRLHRMWSG